MNNKEKYWLVKQAYGGNFDDVEWDRFPIWEVPEEEKKRQAYIKALQAADADTASRGDKLTLDMDRFKTPSISIADYISKLADPEYREAPVGYVMEHGPELSAINQKLREDGKALDEEYAKIWGTSEYGGVNFPSSRVGKDGKRYFFGEDEAFSDEEGGAPDKEKEKQLMAYQAAEELINAEAAKKLEALKSYAWQKNLIDSQK